MGEQATVMLIEDDHDHAVLAMEVLKNSKLIDEVLWFSSGESALDYLTGGFRSSDFSVPDLILLSTMLTESDGLDVLREVRSNRETSRIPIILTATANNEDGLTAGLKRGASSCILKPFSREEFERAFALLKTDHSQVSKLFRQK